MLKIYKWIWRRAQDSVVKEMLALIDSYFVEPQILPNNADPVQKAQFNRDLHIYKAGQTFRQIYLAQFDEYFNKD